MENVLPSERKNVKTSVGLSDKSKVRIIMKYLSMTRDEFCNEFRVLKSTMEGILKGSSKLGCKSKGKIIELYPEISKIWLEYGVGDMNGGILILKLPSASIVGKRVSAAPITILGAPILRSG